MALQKVLNVSGTAVPVMGDEIDTDRIIPARFMKCVTFDGLGEFAFADAIKEAENAGRVFPFKSEKFAGASVLVSGANFGCGSSREHAPQALYRAGIRGIIAGSFAEIFFGNSTTLGIPCVSLPREKLNELADLINQQSEMVVEIDLEEKCVKAGDWVTPFTIAETAYQALVEGKFDPIAELSESNIDGVAASLPYVSGY